MRIMLYLGGLIFCWCCFLFWMKNCLIFLVVICFFGIFCIFVKVIVILLLLRFLRLFIVLLYILNDVYFKGIV